MKVGDILELKIDSVGMDGEGVARHDGKVVFIPYTLVGEYVKCKTAFVNKNFARAKVIKVLEESSNRIAPICKQFFQCGGCSMMHLCDSEYDRVKVENLANCLRKIAKIEPNIKPLVKVGSPYAYRNKIQLPIGKINDKIVVGYYQEKSHKLVPFNKCYLHGEWAEEIIAIFVKFANENKLSVYDETSGKGLLRHLVLRKIGKTVSIVIVINGNELPFYNKLVYMLSGIAFNLHININRKQTNVITSEHYRLLYGKQTIEEELNGIKLSLSPASFMQINTNVAVEIYNTLKKRLAKIGNAVVIEGYSGIGILSNMLAEDCLGIVSVEIVKEAVSDAEKMIKVNNNQDKILPLCGDAAQLIPLIAQAFRLGNTEQLEDNVAFDKGKLEQLNSFINGENILVSVIDPPRKGCDSIVLESLITAQPDFIYYISCNPSTLARDVAQLSVKYDVIDVTPFDMFPLTASLESLVELRKREI